MRYKANVISILEAADITKHVLQFGLWTGNCLDLLQCPACQNSEMQTGDIAYA